MSLLNSYLMAEEEPKFDPTAAAFPAEGIEGTVIFVSGGSRRRSFR